MFEVACALTDVLAIHPASRDPFSPGPREQLNPLLNILSMLRNGDHRFMPLLLSKVHEVLPKLANPMLQNVPDSVANNACNNVDIFDGFGNAGMAQPPAMMDTYEKKFSPADSSSSQAGASSSSNDMQSPFVSSPISPAGEFPHGLQNNSFMSDVMMNQMSQSTPASHSIQIPTSNAPATSHSQHTPHTPATPMPTINPHMQNGHGLNTSIEQPSNLGMSHQNQNFEQSFNQGIPFHVNTMGQDMNSSSMVQRQASARANSFAIPQNHQLRTVGDFQALQRANSDMATLGSLGLNGGMQVGTELDFSSLR